MTYRSLRCSVIRTLYRHIVPRLHLVIQWHFGCHGEVRWQTENVGVVQEFKGQGLARVLFHGCQFAHWKQNTKSYYPKRRFKYPCSNNTEYCMQSKLSKYGKYVTCIDHITRSILYIYSLLFRSGHHPYNNNVWIVVKIQECSIKL